jgi:DNA-binding PadR family transcriptional regulator
MTRSGKLPAMPTLGYAILALLSRGPLAGGELSNQLRDPIGLYWEARHSQIYPVLSRLAYRGWIASPEPAPPGLRPRRSYEITDQGLDALRAWVAAPPSRRSHRDELLLRVYASWVCDREVAIGLLRRAEAGHRDRLRDYLARRAAVDTSGELGPPGSATFADYATLRRGIGFERGRLAWVRWLIRSLELGD